MTTTVCLLGAKTPSLSFFQTIKFRLSLFGEERGRVSYIRIMKWWRKYNQKKKSQRKDIHTHATAPLARPIAEKITTIIFPGQAEDARRGEEEELQRGKKSNLKISLTSPVSLFILHEFLRASGWIHLPSAQRCWFLFFLMNIKVVRDDEKLRTLERL